MRSMNMPSYASQQPQQPNSASARQTPRLQNTQKPGLGNGTGWGFGLPNNSAGGAVPGGFAGAAAAGAALGNAPGLGPRPTQLSGFAQVMGGGGAQAPIDMR
jgi:CCR4-NOT transcription complex subunit 2